MDSSALDLKLTASNKNYFDISRAALSPLLGLERLTLTDVVEAAFRCMRQQLRKLLIPGFLSCGAKLAKFCSAAQIPGNSCHHQKKYKGDKEKYFLGTLHVLYQT